MELEWVRDKPDIDLYYEDDLVGWVRYHSDGPYTVTVSGCFGIATHPCEDQKYVTLREAMRALKATATVLLIGGHHET